MARGSGRPAACGVLAVLTAVLLGTPGVAAAAVPVADLPAPVAVQAPADPPPSPNPPPNPDDQQLDRSRGAVEDRSREIGQLNARLGELADEQDDLQIQVATQHESANQARDVSDRAGVEAATAADRSVTARTQTEQAGVAVDAARDRLDRFVGDVYGHGLDLGPLGLLSRATDPGDLMDRARLTDALSQEQAGALEALEQARVVQANAESRARAAQQEADRRKADADQARADADRALADAEQAVDAQRGQIDAVDAEQAGVQRQLDAAQDADATLRGQRQRYVDWQAAQAAAEAARAQQARDAAIGRERARSEASGEPEPRRDVPQRGPQRGSDAIETVIDRATAQLGIRYSWGGGNADGPTKGIRDGGVADTYGDYKKVGFDCSGLMLYAFAGIGIDLPRYSGNQHKAGDQVPVAQMRRGDMLAWARNGRTYHIALYLGDGKMLEAPYSGSEVKISPVRYKNLMPTVTRMV